MDIPIKCLGKWYDVSLKDTNNIIRIKNQLQDGLKLIDKTWLPGKFKAWLYQHGLLPTLLWPLTLYEIATGKKWSASQAVSQTESRLWHKDIVGTTAVERQGLDNTKPQRWITSCNKERSQILQQEIRLTEVEDRQSRAVGMGCQCTWTRWKTTERHLTWEDIWHNEPLRLKFLLSSVCDLLPSPANLHRWGLVEDPSSLDVTYATNQAPCNMPCSHARLH